MIRPFGCAVREDVGTRFQTPNGHSIRCSGARAPRAPAEHVPQIRRRAAVASDEKLEDRPGTKDFPAEIRLNCCYPAAARQ